MNKTSQILTVNSTSDYALLDSGEGEKLERFGKVVLSRPDPQAVWAKRLPATEWKKADGHFSREESGGKWSLKPHTPAKWEVTLGGLKFWIKPTAFKHTGLFPEQEENWRWVKNLIESSIGKVSRDTPSSSGDDAAGALSAKQEFVNSPSLAPKRPERSFPLDSSIEILNLFGYTGGATLACAQAGAKVVHIDGSKAAITWARENAEASGLKDAPIRWIIEDARVFVEREIKRGRKYHGIIMDPPAFGHGPTKELWKIEEHFLPLVEDCKKLLADKPLFFLINGYSAGYSAVAYENMLIDLKTKFGGEVEIGELTIEESSYASPSRNASEERGKATEDKGKSESQARLLPAGIFARWSGK